MNDSVRIAMWSGPRNISTALLRSWGNRRDTYVCDEPLYAHYLSRTGYDHPGADQIIAHHETDWRKVVSWLTGPIPDGKTVFYQKQMAHHLIDSVERDWIYGLNNCILIREPLEMLTSLLKIYPEAGLLDTGLPQQLELVDELERRNGRKPLIIDSRDLLGAPGAYLEAICAEVGIGFSEDMLRWPKGPRDTDGVWARHWYSRVYETTGFVPFRSKGETLDDDKRDLLDRCNDIYSTLYEARLRIN